jgi:hypothetical protein
MKFEIPNLFETRRTEKPSLGKQSRFSPEGEEGWFCSCCSFASFLEVI